MPRKRGGFRMSTRKLDLLIDNLEQGYEAELAEAFDTVAAEAEDAMVELAPYDTGELERSVSRETEAFSNFLQTRIEFDAPHASLAHELPETSRGPGTREKPGNRYGVAGPKYVERVLAAFPFAERIARVYSKILSDTAKAARRKS